MGLRHPGPAQRPGLTLSPTRLIVAAALAAAVLPQHARGATETRSIAVHAAHPHPRTPDQARKLYRRLAMAALEVCGASHFSLPELRMAVRRSTCWQDAMTRAVASTDSPLLAAEFDRTRAPGTKRTGG